MVACDGRANRMRACYARFACTGRNVRRVDGDGALRRSAGLAPGVQCELLADGRVAGGGGRCTEGGGVDGVLGDEHGLADAGERLQRGTLAVLIALLVQ